MKKVLLSLAVAAFLASCGSEPAAKEGGETPTTADTTVVKTEPAKPVEPAQPVEPVVVENDTTNGEGDSTNVVDPEPQAE